MSTPNPEQPAPTPRTDGLAERNAALLQDALKETPSHAELGVIMTECLQVWYEHARQLERELNAAKQPVPDAGVREKVGSTIESALKKSSGTWLRPMDVDAITEAILALLPAPKDTRLLDYMEREVFSISCNADGVTIERADDGAEYKGDTLRQALRAAMAHAGEQKT